MQPIFFEAPNMICANSRIRVMMLEIMLICDEYGLETRLAQSDDIHVFGSRFLCLSVWAPNMISANSRNSCIGAGSSAYLFWI